jgi:hypothetical protein
MSVPLDQQHVAPIKVSIVCTEGLVSCVPKLNTACSLLQNFWKPMMAAADDLAALREQLALASSAAFSASDLDHAYHLQLAEVIQASLLHSPNGNTSSPSPSVPVAESSSDADYAFAIQTADLVRAEQNRLVAAHDALFARELAAIPEDQWAHDGDYFERPLDADASRRPLFRVLSKGMASKEVVGPRERDPRVAILAVALCGPQGEVLLRTHKPLERFVGGRMMVEVMALMEGIQSALALGVTSVTIVTAYRPLYNHVCHYQFICC